MHRQTNPCQRTTFRTPANERPARPLCSTSSPPLWPSRAGHTRHDRRYVGRRRVAGAVAKVVGNPDSLRWSAGLETTPW